MITPNKADELAKSFKAIKAWFNDYELLHINDASLINDEYGVINYIRANPDNTYQFVLYNPILKTTFAVTELSFVNDHMNGFVDEGALHCLIIKRLENDYGYIRVNPATLGQSIGNLIQTGDLNFSHYPKFEELYTVKADNTLKASKFFTPERISLFETVGDVQLLINKNTLLSRIAQNDAHGDWIHLLNMAAHLD